MTEQTHDSAGEQYASSGARISFDDVRVHFGSTVALAGVSFEIPRGQIVGLLGHNGAGKSTLLNIATGAVHATSGAVSIDGHEVPEKATPKAVSQLGVTVIHQEPALAGNLSILDNLYLAKSNLPSREQQRKDAREALDQVGGNQLDLSVPVGALSLGERQLVDLARGLLTGEVKVLMLDEPTAALGEAETRALHALIRRLAAAGTSVIYVSHRLPDIVDVCDRVVVLRGGAVVMDSPTEGMSVAELSTALAPEIQLEEEWSSQPGETALEVKYNGAELAFREGEIVGLYGMAAGEQFHLMDELFGLRGHVDAKLYGEQYAPNSPNQAIRKRVHLVPADRESDGLVSELSAKDNTYLPWMSRGFLSPKKRSKHYSEVRKKLNVHGPDGDAPIVSYSGGNRQKHLIARWMFPVPPKVLLLSQPTQGVDVGAKKDIREALRALADAGVCIVIASAETDEIASLCERTYVLAHTKSQQVHQSPKYEESLLQTLLDLTPVGDLH